MIKRKSKALLCAIASIGFINSIEIIHANAYNNSFSDTKGHWAEAEISKFNDLGYISGYEDKTFKPNNSVTRAEFVKILNNSYENAIPNRFGVEKNDDPLKMLEGIAEVRGCKLKGNVLDLEKASSILLEEFRSGKLGKITLDRL